MSLPEHNKLQVEAFKATDIPLDLILVVGSIIGIYKELCSEHNYVDTTACILTIKYHI